MPTTKEEMQKAKSLIQQKRYDDARALLITVDHPKADVWLNRLNQMTASTHTNQPTSDKSFTSKLFITVVLLLFFIIPGFIALLIFTPEAKKYPDAPGAQGLIALNRIVFGALLILGILLVIVLVSDVIVLPGFPI